MSYASFASGWFTRPPTAVARQQAQGCAMDSRTDYGLKRFKARLLASCLGFMMCGHAAAQETIVLPGLLVTGSRIGTGITGASTTVITAEEIERSPSLTVQDILAREPGVQVQNLFGGVNGARSTVDLRGFGATG